MTQAEAAEELRRLANGLGMNLGKSLTDEEGRSWLRVITSVSRDVARAAITELIDTWPHRNRFPLRSDFLVIATRGRMEGVPNADAYSGGTFRREFSNNERRAVALNERWARQSQEEYAHELQALIDSGFDPLGRAG